MADIGDKLKAWCVNVGFISARKVFRVRGNHTEVHLTLEQLATVCRAVAEATCEKVMAEREAQLRQGPG